MNSESNAGDSLHNKPLKDSGSLNPHQGPTSLTNQGDFDIAEEVPEQQETPLIHDLRPTQRNQADTNPLGTRPQEQEQELIREQEQEEQVKQSRAHPSELEESEEEEEELIAETQKEKEPEPEVKPEMKREMTGSWKKYLDESPGTKIQSGKLVTEMNETKRLLQTEADDKEEQSPTKRSRKAPLRRGKTYEQKKKEMREDYIESSDLLPEGVESVEELKRMFEEKRNFKRSNHLDFLPKVHQGDVLCVMFSPDYRFIVSGSADRSIKILDAETKQEVYHIKEAHEESVTTIAMTSDMKYLVSGSADKSIKVFDFATKQPVYQFKDAHEHPIIDLAISSDNRYIISASEKDSVKIFHLSSKQQVHHFTNIFNDTIESVKVTPDNKFLVVRTKDGSITIIDILTKQKTFTFEANSSREFTAMEITHDSSFIIAGDYDGSIKILNISDREEVDCFKYEPEGNMKTGDNPVSQLVLSYDGQEIFVGHDDGSIVKFNLKTKEKKVLQGINRNITQLAVSKKADFLIACSAKQSSIHLIDVEPKEKNAISLQRPSRDSVSHLQIGLAISPDSKYILSAMGSKSIKIIDSETKQQVYKDTFTFTNTISAIAITPNNKFIVVGLSNGSVHVCDFGKETVHHKFEYVHNRSVTRLAVTPDSRYVIVELYESFVMLDIVERKEVHTFEGVHKEMISDVAVTPDGKFIVSASYDKSIKLFDLVTKKQVHHFKDVHKGEIYALRVSPNSKFIISAARDFSIKIFDIETKNLVYEFVYAHDNSIFGLAISSDSRYVASNSADNSVKVFDIETKQLVYSLQNLHSNWGWALAFAPNDKFIVSAALDDSLKFINFETKMEDGQIKKGGPVRAMAISPNDELVVSSSQHYLRAHNMKTKEKVFETVIKGYETGKSLVFSSDSKLVIYGTETGSIGVFDYESKQTLYSKKAHTDKVYALIATPDDKFIISGSQDKSIKISHLQTGEVYHHFKDIHEETVRSLKLTPDGRFLISASADKTIKIIDIEEKKQVYSFNAHPRWIKCIDVSSDGKFLVSCSDDRSIKIFDFKTKQLVHWFKNAHDDFINSIAISKDCRFIVSGSSDKSIKVFDIQTYQLVHAFEKVHTNTIKYVAITSDNRYIISGSYDGSIKFLKLTPTGPLPQKSSQNLGIITQNGLDVSESDFYYVYNGFSHYLNFNAVDDFLFNPNIPIKSAYATTIRCQDLTIFPYKWNILHLLAIRGQHIFIKNLPEYAQFRVPFLLDAFNKTPLHYLVAHEKLNSASVNFMLNYICDYLEHLTRHENSQAQEIIISLTPLFWFILTKTDIKVRQRFLTTFSFPPPVPYTAELPAFGIPKSDIATFHPTLEAIYSSIPDMLENGEDQVDFRANIVNLDYNVLSNDMEKTVKCLSKQKNEEVFKTTLIIDLINHLWDQTKLFLQIKFLLFSAYVIALSIYLSFEDRTLPYEIVILSCAGFFCFAELLQAINLKQDYFKDPWNWIDLIFHPLTIAYVIARMLGTEDELVRAWISTMILLFGYLRWISYLRIFKPTRNLIQVVVTVVNDMKSFIIIIALIIIGFSFIFMVFNRGRLYGFYLYNAYGSLYGPVDDGEASPSEQFFIALIAFLLNVILLNLLISIMGDSYAKVLEKRIKTDSLTRLDMISEAVTFLRFLRKKKPEQRGFLVLCESLNSADDDGDDAGDEWEERIIILKNLLKQNENSAKKEMKALQQNFVRTEEKRKDNEEKLQQKVTSLESELEKMRIEQEKARKEQEKAREEQEKQNEKTNEILTLLSEMRQKLIKEPQNGVVQN